MTQNNPRKKDTKTAEWCMAIGSLVGLAISIIYQNPTYFAIGLSVGIAIGYSLDKQNETKR